MATQSIKKNIVIHDKNSAAAFVKALEKAASISSKPVSSGCKVKELKGTQDIKAFFGDEL